MDITDEQWSQAIENVYDIIADLEDSDNHDDDDSGSVIEALLFRYDMGERSEQLYNSLVEVKSNS